MPPIDFFTPEYYNEVMDMEERIFYANDSIAFPALDLCTNARSPEWTGMKAAMFMPKFGNAMLTLYNRPSEEDITAWEAEQKRKEDGEEPEPMDLDDTDDEMEEV
jgi:hypothetical protein